VSSRPLLEWLLLKHPDTPKSRAKQWIIAGRVSVDGVVIRKPHQPLEDPGKSLKLADRHATTLGVDTGWEIHPRVTLLHLDSAVAIVNKGAGLLSVPAMPAEDDLSALSILTDYLAGRLKPRNRELAARTLPPAYRRLQPLPVHRLDQYTTGVFCMATNPTARQHLIAQLKAHTMTREYVAFVEGRPRSPNGVWRHSLHLSRDELHQQVLSETQADDAGPETREAITHYEVEAEYPVVGSTPFVTKLRLRLETGLKHQIRVQAAHVGLPLVGDRTYNPSCRRGYEATGAIQFERQALHAWRLSLEHPNEPGKRMSWTAGLPKDLRELEAALRSGRPATC
jgi:23S rRNA pseudouridine1911/1915/1917 synthase